MDQLSRWLDGHELTADNIDAVRVPGVLGGSRTLMEAASDGQGDATTISAGLGGAGSSCATFSRAAASSRAFAAALAAWSASAASKLVSAAYGIWPSRKMAVSRPRAAPRCGRRGEGGRLPRERPQGLGQVRGSKPALHTLLRVPIDDDAPQGPRGRRSALRPPRPLTAGAVGARLARRRRRPMRRCGLHRRASPRRRARACRRERIR
jgi:hypothetical protein